MDVVVHAGGSVSDWATAVAPGDRIDVAGPPGGFVVGDGYGRYVLGGDLTALPAIARRLESMPGDARGAAFVEFEDEADVLAVEHPPALPLTWVGPGTLAEAVRSAEIDRDTYVWVAGEAGAIKPLRRWLRSTGADHRVTGYWKRGESNLADDGH